MAKKVYEEDYILEEGDLESIADQIFFKFKEKFQELKEGPELIIAMKKLDQTTFMFFMEVFAEEAAKIRPETKSINFHPATFGDKEYLKLLNSRLAKSKFEKKLRKMVSETQFGTFHRIVRFAESLRSMEATNK